MGRVPEQTESIAELMLFDSDVNVYGDSNVYIEDFDARTRGCAKSTSRVRSKTSKSFRRHQRLSKKEASSLSMAS